MSGIKVLSLFSGIGAFEKALTNLDIDYDLVGFSEIDEDAIKAYSAIHNVPIDKNYGDVSVVDTSEIADFDLMTYGFPCFKAGTLVLTDNGYKNIEDIVKGDMVLTHTNTYKEVVVPMSKTANHIYKLRTSSSEDLYVTKEHPLYARKRTRTYNNRSTQRHFEAPEWVKVSELSKDYYLGVAVNQKSELPEWAGVKYIRGHWKNFKTINELNAYFPTEEFWWIVGRYMGDGWTTNYKRKGRENSYNQRTIICCEKKRLSEITTVLDILGKYFKYSVVEERTVFKIHIVNKELTNYLYRFGKGAKNKHLTSDILNLPDHLIKAFIEGYLSSDGYIDKNGVHKISSISRELIYGVGQCVAKAYKRPYSVDFTKRNPTCVIEGRVCNQNHTYTIRFKLTTDKQDNAFYEDGYVWSPINGISKEDYNGLVYNFEVEEDNSYTVNNIIAHNCQAISKAGKLGGMVEGSNTTSSLLWEAMKIAEVKKPKYMIAENVRNLLSKKFKNDFDKWLLQLDGLGYNTYYEVLNARHYGIPQNRERVFVVSIRKDVDEGTFKFPTHRKLKLNLLDLMDIDVDEKYYISKEDQDKLTHHEEYGQIYIKNATKLGYLPANHGDGIDLGYPNSETRRGRVQVERSQTLTTGDGLGILIGNRIRRFTPIECYRLMGFSDQDFLKAKEQGISDRKLYKQAGNSIVVNVLEAILNSLLIGETDKTEVDINNI